MDPHRDSTPSVATVDDLYRYLEFLHMDRVVIVAAGAYRFDNSATLEAVQHLGQSRARGVAWVHHGSPLESLERLKRAGIVGVRWLLPNGNPLDRRAAEQHLQAGISIAKPYGWHLDILTSPDVIGALEDQLASSPVPIVLDYFGWARSVDQDGFGSIRSLIKSGPAYVKLSEPYRLSKNVPDYSDLVPVVDALIKSNPDRVLWGSGWPHVSGGSPGRARTQESPNLPIDAGHLLNLLAAWVPDRDVLHKILVDNPARFYGFSPS
jgi:predicted TIM-barrel fold metal-dependent hydrolase